MNFVKTQNLHTIPPLKLLIGVMCCPSVYFFFDWCCIQKLNQWLIQFRVQPAYKHQYKLRDVLSNRIGNYAISASNMVYMFFCHGTLPVKVQLRYQYLPHYTICLGLSPSVSCCWAKLLISIRRGSGSNKYLYPLHPEAELHGIGIV